VDAICHGAGLAAPGVLSLRRGSKKVTLWRFYVEGRGCFFRQCPDEVSDILRAATGIVVSTDRVLLEAGHIQRMEGKSIRIISFI